MIRLAWLGVAGLAAAGLASSAACTDSGEADTEGPPAVTVGTGSGDSSSSSSGSSSSGTGGMGGAGPCLATSPATAYFSVETTDLCVVAQYDAPAMDLTAAYASPTWGAHDGPLTARVTQNGTTADVVMARWALAGTTLMKTETTAPVTGLTNPAFFTGEILDLPIPGAVIGWQGTDFMNDGGVFALSATMQTADYTALGVFSFAAVGPDTNNAVRLLYTGLSALDGPTTNVPALYAADLESDGTPIAPSAAIAAWGSASGPVAADAAGNVFAVATTGANQELRGFASSSIAPTKAPTSGVTLFTLPGFGSELAAVAPVGAVPGLVVYQPQMGAGLGQDVIVQRFTSDGATLAAAGASATLLKLATAGTNVNLMTDRQGRLWVGAKNTQAAGTVFFVLARP